MVVEHYISELLYRYNCVVVPHFGAFLTQKTPARIQENTNTFLAPTKSIGFNEQLKSNDGLLVSHIAKAENTSFEVVLSELENQAKAWMAQLNDGAKLSLKNIGTLWSGAEGKIQFQPYTEVNYLSSSFGLTTFNAIPVTREVLKEEVVAVEERIPFIISHEKRAATSLFRPYLKYAAILLLAVSTGVTGYRLYTNGIQTQQLARQEAQKKVTQHIQEATFFDTTPLELPTISLNAVYNPKKAASTAVTSKSSSGALQHHIVAGAFRVKANADRKISELKRKGFDAAYYGTNAYGLHMVTYERYSNAQDALLALSEIKATESSDAWLLSKK